jgi:hypothetical protein
MVIQQHHGFVLRKVENNGTIYLTFTETGFLDMNEVVTAPQVIEFLDLNMELIRFEKRVGQYGN